MDKFVYLDLLHERNETPYFRVLADHLAELLPVVYDPTVGQATKEWSTDYRVSEDIDNQCGGRTEPPRLVREGRQRPPGVRV